MSKPKFKIGDKVRILDGSEIKDYTGGFAGGMAALVGQVATVQQVQPSFQGGRVAYYLSGARGVASFVWDERGLEPVTEAKEKIVIYREGRSVFAKNLLTGKIAEAKCNPEDQFIFRIGAELAFDRLMGREEKKPEEPKPEEPKRFTGKVVCVESAHPCFWTVGRVYDVRDGVIRDDANGRRAGAKSPADISRLTDPRTKFIALVE